MDETTPQVSSLSRQAIDAALNCKWTDAVTLNKQIIDLDSQNTAALNRLAKAYCEQGQFSEAKKLYAKVLDIDPYNPIAAKNLKRVQTFKNDGAVHVAEHDTQKLSASSFLQEPGVTKIVNLIKLAEPSKLSTLSTGMEVKLNPKNRGITINDLDNSYVGVLPDDISFQLLRLIKGGNKYQAVIKAIRPNGLTVLIREVFRSRKFKNQPSFLEESHITSFPSDHISIPSEGSGDDAPTEEETEV